jgi:hypothetical protein
MRILKGLREDEFGQKTVKCGVGLEVLILQRIERLENRNPKLEIRKPGPTPGVFGKEFGVVGKQRSCGFWDGKRVRKSMKKKDGELRFVAMEGADRRF